MSNGLKGKRERETKKQDEQNVKIDTLETHKKARNDFVLLCFPFTKCF